MLPLACVVLLRNMRFPFTSLSWNNNLWSANCGGVFIDISWLNMLLHLSRIAPLIGYTTPTAPCISFEAYLSGLEQQCCTRRSQKPQYGSHSWFQYGLWTDVYLTRSDWGVKCQNQSVYSKISESNSAFKNGIWPLPECTANLKRKLDAVEHLRLTVHCLPSQRSAEVGLGEAFPSASCVMIVIWTGMLTSYSSSWHRCTKFARTSNKYVKLFSAQIKT